MILPLAILPTLVGAVGVAVIFGVADLGSSGTDGHRHLATAAVAIVALALVLAYRLMFVSTFFNTAIAAAAAAGLQGRRFSLGQALARPAGGAARRVGAACRDLRPARLGMR